MFGCVKDLPHYFPDKLELKNGLGYGCLILFSPSRHPAAALEPALVGVILQFPTSLYARIFDLFTTDSMFTSVCSLCILFCVCVHIHKLMFCLSNKVLDINCSIGCSASAAVTRNLV